MPNNDLVTVTDYGAVGNGIADDTAAIQRAVDALASGILLFPRGSYRLTAGIVIANKSGLTLIGEGAYGGTQILWAPGSGTAFTFSGCYHSGIERMYLRGVTIPIDGWGLEFTRNCYQCHVFNVRVDYFYGGIQVAGCTETRLTRINLRYLYGSAGVRFAGLAGTPSFRMVINDISADNPYPLPIGPVRDWSPGTAFNAGEVILNNAAIYQCMVSGTSAPAGNGPAGSSGGFVSNIPDGTAEWRFVCRDLHWLVMDSLAYSLVVNQAALIDGLIGFSMTDTAGTGTSYPIWAYLTDLECDHSFYDCMLLEGGEGVYAATCWLGSSLSNNGLEIALGFRGEVSLTTSRIMGNNRHGVLLSRGPVDVLIDGCMIGDNSQAETGAFHGIAVAGGAQRFVLSTNRIGDLIGASGDRQGFGIRVNRGNSDHYVISGNMVQGNTISELYDGGTGINKWVTGNVA